jgi:predicted nucleic-acid-binding Zn-ribbon protein
MMNKSEGFNPCPRCGGEPTMRECRFGRDSEYMEIQCMNCGLTLKYDADVVYQVNGPSITFAPNITWSYSSDNYKSAAEAWDAGVKL